MLEIGIWEFYLFITKQELLVILIIFTHIMDIISVAIQIRIIRDNNFNNHETTEISATKVNHPEWKH